MKTKDHPNIAAFVQKKQKKSRKAEREKHEKWAFSELRNFIEYKARLAGSLVQYINPKNTSRQCSVCSYISKNNRKNQAEFVCRSCGNSENADYNAAKNISFRAAINLPIVLCIGLSCEFEAQAPML